MGRNTLFYNNFPPLTMNTFQGFVMAVLLMPIMGGQVQHFRFLTCREGPGCVEVFALQWATNCQLFFMIPGEHHHLPTFKAYIEWVPATTDVVAVVSEPK